MSEERQGSLIHRLETWQSVIERVALWGSRIALVFMMLLTTADVFMRYALNNPITGAYEFTEFGMVFLVFLAVAYVQSEKGHITVDFVFLRVSPRTALMLRVLGYIVGLLIFTIVTWRAGDYAWQAWVTHDYTVVGGASKLPLWPAKSVLALGTGLLCLRLILDIAHGLSDLIRQFRQQPDSTGGKQA